MGALQRLLQLMARSKLSPRPSNIVLLRALVTREVNVPQILLLKSVEIGEIVHYCVPDCYLKPKLPAVLAWYEKCHAGIARSLNTMVPKAGNVFVKLLRL